MSPTPPSFSRRTPLGDDRPRAVCDRCGFVDYVNPKLVVGVVATDADQRLLMCRRAIEPRRGFWTLPAGFMEEGESVEAAALREAREEARVELDLGPLLGVYSVPRISQVQMFFRARLLNEPAAGPESEAVALYAWDEIPWSDLAFPTVAWALEDWRDGRGAVEIAPRLRTAPYSVLP